MPKFAANLSMMYNEVPFTERFAAAAADGFQGVEYLFPYAWQPEELKALLEQHGLQQVLFNAPPGDWDGGERGLAALPGREAEFREGIALALNYAQVLGNRLIHVMAGILPDGADPLAYRNTYLNNLSYAADLAEQAGCRILIEPINHADMPGYFLRYQAQAAEICAELKHPALAVQFDIYHCQRTEGSLSHWLQDGLAREYGQIAHIQLAGYPGRHEPDTGEIHYPFLFQRMDELAYSGWVGCEYRPQGNTSAGLGWLRALLMSHQQA